MITSEIRNSVWFRLLIIATIASAMLLATGCQKIEEAKKETASPPATYANLQAAYAREAQMITMYSLFVGQAQKEHNMPAAALFSALKRSEEIHARNHIRLLVAAGIEAQKGEGTQPVVGTVAQTLKMALSTEEIEYGSVYPPFLNAALHDKRADAAEQFQQTALADKRHGELLLDAINHNGGIPKAHYRVCPACGYIVTGDEERKCPVCSSNAAQFEKLSS